MVEGDKYVVVCGRGTLGRLTKSLAWEGRTGVGQ